MQTGPVLRRKRLGIIACPEANASSRATAIAIVAWTLTRMVTRLQKNRSVPEPSLKLVPFVGPSSRRKRVRELHEVLETEADSRSDAHFSKKWTENWGNCVLAIRGTPFGRCNRQQDGITIRAVGVIHLCVLRASFVVNSVLLGSSPDRGAFGHSYKPNPRSSNGGRGFLYVN